MTKREPPTSAPGPGGPARAERLAAALQANLKRRKAQARERAAADRAADERAAAPHDSAGIADDKRSS